MTTEHEDEGNAEQADHALLEALKSAYGRATGIEPALGQVARGHVDALASELAEVARLRDAGLAATELDQRADAEQLIAIVYGRCAAVAIAAGDEGTAHRWLIEAERYAREEQLRHELTAARSNPERYRMLVHGRNRMANGDDGTARKLWSDLAKAGAADTIARAAAEELKAPRPLKDGQMPTLWRLNGFGLGFYGHRDDWDDGSYVTTHCISALWIPVFPVGAYRVRDGGDGGYYVMAREQVSSFARATRWVLALGIVGAIAYSAINAHFNDPGRLARKHFDETIETAAAMTPEAALRTLDAELARPETWRVDADRVQGAGATIVKLTAGFVAKPFTRDHLDQAARVVRRYQALPDQAQGGASRQAVLAALDGWIKELGDAPAAAEARLALLRHELGVAGSPQDAAIAQRISDTRLAVAATKEADWPLEAFEMLVEEKTATAVERATKLVERIAESPALLVDAGRDLDAWAARATGPIKERALAQRDAGLAAQKESEAEKLTAAQLAAMVKQRPWDQFAVVHQARDEASAGKLDAAAARLGKLGAPGMMTREARMLLGQIDTALGKLEEADALLTSLLGARLQRFAAASGQLDEAVKAADKRLETTDVPYDVQQKWRAMTEEDRTTAIREWANERIANDPKVSAAREAYVALADIVPVCLAAGTVKLRRAQAMPDGPARSAMLVEAERTYLAIRSAAEGQPEFRLGLGEIYARLGKTKESEAEFAAVLEKREPELMLRVASTYRAIGSVERSKQVATDVFEHGSVNESQKSHAAVLLALLAGDDSESEGWYRKATQTDPFVRTSLLAIEGRKLFRQGKRAECGAKFVQVAKAHLAIANAVRTDGYNNAGVAHLNRFQCTGDLSALTDAEAVLEKAYRTSREDAIVVGNFAATLENNGQLRALGKRIDLHKYAPVAHDAQALLEVLLDSPERAAVLADLAADPGIRRGDQVYSEYEVLAPSNTGPYEHRFEQAVTKRDEAAAAAVVDRAKRATGLDRSDAAKTRARWLSGETDQLYFEGMKTTLDVVEPIAANPKVDARTRAAALYLVGLRLSAAAVYKSDAADLRRAREASAQAMKLWPALESSSTIVACLIDEAGLAADAVAWIKERRERTAVASLAKLAAAGSPIAARIKASAQWGEVAGHARADRSRPGLDDLRLARLLGDAGLEAKARPVLDDKLVRLGRELALALDPSSEVAKEDLAYYDQR